MVAARRRALGAVSRQPRKGALRGRSRQDPQCKAGGARRPGLPQRPRDYILNVYWVRYRRRDRPPRDISSPSLATPVLLPEAHGFIYFVLRAGRRPLRPGWPLADNHRRPGEWGEVAMARLVSAARCRHRTALARCWQQASAPSACTGLQRGSRPLARVMGGRTDEPILGLGRCLGTRCTAR